MQTNLVADMPLPQATDIEESILVACFLGGAAQVVRYLQAEDFYRSAHQKIYSTICQLFQKQIEPDLPVVANALHEAGLLESVGGTCYLAGIIGNAPIPSNIEHYAGIIKDRATRRQLIARAHGTIQACHDITQDTGTIIATAQEKILSLGADTDSGSQASYQALSLSAGDRYEVLSKRAGNLSGIGSGYPTLDMLLCGFQATDLIILAGRPSMGKTAIALNIAGHIGKNGTSAAIFSLEMSKEQLFDRQVALESGVNLQKFRSGRFEDSDREAIVEAQEKIHGWSIHIDDEAALHHLEISRRIHRYQRRFGIKIAIVDHLQLIRGDKSTSRDREIGSITAGLKATAKQVGIPIILLSQLNRKLEERPNPHKRPRLSDLRDSGNIEQDSDVVALLYRPEVYGDTDGNPFPGQAELNIAKQRNGPTGLIKLKWNERTTKFENDS